MKKILVVEDNPLNLKLVREILEHAGYEVVEAESGVMAIETVGKEKPDIVLMDIQLPGMNGVTAISKIREVPEMKDVKAIALTSYAMEADRRKLFESGFLDYIPKPVKVNELLEKVERYI